jgi:hypothetical protein
MDVSNPLDNRNEKLKRNSSPRPRDSIKRFFPDLPRALQKKEREEITCFPPATIANIYKKAEK